MTGGKSEIRKTLALLIAAMSVSMARSGLAVQVEFQLAGPNSLTAAPYINLLLAPMTGQDPGDTSLTTTYSGTVTVDVDDLMNPTSITFVSASAVAANSGDWLPEVGGGNIGDEFVFGDADPGTPAPANYGFFIDLEDIGHAYAASRDTILSLSAAAKPVTGGQFDPFGIGITIPQGTYHFNISSALLEDDAGMDDITDGTGTNCTDEESGGTANRCGANMGSYAVTDDLITLTVPLDFIIAEGADPQVTFTGTFVATYSLEQPLLGDYNNDGKVDAADYTVWRDNVGFSNTLPNDDIGGMIGPDHYTQWANNFGVMSGSGLGSAAVPEPAAATLVAIGLFGLWLGRRRPLQLACLKAPT